MPASCWEENVPIGTFPIQFFFLSCGLPNKSMGRREEERKEKNRGEQTLHTHLGKTQAAAAWHGTLRKSMSNLSFPLPNLTSPRHLLQTHHTYLPTCLVVFYLCGEAGRTPPPLSLIDWFGRKYPAHCSHAALLPETDRHMGGGGQACLETGLCLPSCYLPAAAACPTACLQGGGRTLKRQEGRLSSPPLYSLM